MPRDTPLSKPDPLARLDQEYVWHPFTQMQDWAKEEPIVIRSGKGAVLTDTRGRRYLDANASIWTNLHGHNHPRINRAIATQLTKISHSSALGLANEPASLLAAELVTQCRLSPSSKSQPELTKVFFSDDGSTAMEAALKMHHQFTSRTRPEITPRYLSLENSYHGDTVGAMSLSHSPLFHQPFHQIRFDVDRTMAPYCYRCPFNRAKPKKTDARKGRQCRWECVSAVDKRLKEAQQENKPYTAFVIEPLMQGAAGMIAHPRGYLERISKLIRRHRLQLIADEVMTGLGRTGSLIACHQEGIQPDYLALAKGLTAGYLPLAATLTTQPIFNSFLGPYESFRTFFHGHSFTGNQLGCAAALANLQLLKTKPSIQRRSRLEGWFTEALDTLWNLPHVGDIRQAGLTAGIEMVKDPSTREPFPINEQVGIRICRAMARHGVLTRPVGNVIVLLLIYSLTKRELKTIIATLAQAINDVLDSAPSQ